MICPTEERAVGVVVHHIAARAALVAGWAAAIAAGELPPSVTIEMVHTDNAQHAQQHADCDKPATIDLLRRSGAAAANIVRSLSDEQLARAVSLALFGGQPASVESVVETLLIGHVYGHPPAIQAALAGEQPYGI